MSRRYRILITQVVSVFELCLEMRFCLTSVRHLSYGVGNKTPCDRALKKIRDSLTW